MALKQTDTVLKAWLTRATSTGGPYDPAATFLGVATAVDDHGADTVIGDVTEAGGDLSDRIAVTPWGTPHKLADGRWAVDGPLAIFRPADDTEAATITFWFLATLVAAGVLKAWAPVSPPVYLIDENSTISILPRITIDPEGRFSAEIVVNG